VHQPRMNSSTAATQQRFMHRRLTLPEILVVIICLACLAVLMVGTFFRIGQGESAARSRTVSTHAVIQAALEQYREKFGTYPEPADPKEQHKFAGIALPVGDAHMLYQAITGDGDSAIAMESPASRGTSESDGRVSDEEVKNTLSSSPLPKSVIYPPNLPADTVSPRFLVDGWGRPFQYTKGNPDPAKNKAVNPTYDLWSLGPERGTFPPSDSLATKRIEQISGSWIKNW
jgi:type II secretory pathway pseudopilin PulG